MWAQKFAFSSSPMLPIYIWEIHAWMSGTHSFVWMKQMLVLITMGKLGLLFKTYLSNAAFCILYFMCVHWNRNYVFALYFLNWIYIHIMLLRANSCLSCSHFFFVDKVKSICADGKCGKCIIIMLCCTLYLISYSINANKI